MILTDRKRYIKYKIFNIRNNNKLYSIKVDSSWSLANFAVQVFSVQILSVQIFSDSSIYWLSVGPDLIVIASHPT